MIKYRMMDGAFVVGDTETGNTSYAYPTSTHATAARKAPLKTAEQMVKDANAFAPHIPAHLREATDALNWARLNAGSGCA